MTSREIIQAALDFGRPERVGLRLPEPYGNDMVIGYRKSLNVAMEPRGGEVRRWRDQWGSVWASLTEFDKGEVVEESISDWAQLDDYRPPDLGLQADYDPCAQAFADSDDKYRIGQLPGFVFSIARKLRKMDNYLCDLVLAREHIDRLNAMVRGELLKAIGCMSVAGADAIMFGEDWGTQDQLLVSPAMWREIFKPEFQTLVGAARDCGMRVIMHSCGKMTDIIPDLIECGVNCFQFDQPRLHGIEFLADSFGGKVAFWCPVDIQTTLQTRNRELIRAEAKLLIEKLGAFDGGFIADRYGNDAAIGLPPEVQNIACEAFVEFAANV